MQLSIDGIINSNSSTESTKATEPRRQTNRDDYEVPLPNGMLHDDLFSADLRASGMVFFEKVTVGQLSNRISRRQETVAKAELDENNSRSETPQSSTQVQNIPVLALEETEKAHNQNALFEPALETGIDLDFSRYAVTDYDDSFDDAMYDLPYPKKQGFEVALSQLRNGVTIAIDGFIDVAYDYIDEVKTFVSAASRKLVTLVRKTPDVNRAAEIYKQAAPKTQQLARKLGLKRANSALYMHRVVIAILATALVIAL